MPRRPGPILPLLKPSATECKEENHEENRCPFQRGTHSPALAYSYCDRCKSINMRPQGDELFTCVASFCAGRKVGDQTK